MRRRSLLKLGVSLTEQARLSARELDEIVHVEAIYAAEEQRRAEDQSRKG